MTTFVRGGVASFMGAIHRAADSHIPTMACLFRGLWQDAADELDTAELEDRQRLDRSA